MQNSQERIAVLYPSGSRAYSVVAHEARQMIRAGVAVALGKGKHIRSIQLQSGPSSIPTGQKYSHCHETPTNPTNCWTLRHIDSQDRHVFIASITDCMRSAV